jgi:hypothetical protein
MISLALILSKEVKRRKKDGEEEEEKKTFLSLSDPFSGKCQVSWVT